MDSWSVDTRFALWSLGAGYIGLSCTDPCYADSDLKELTGHPKGALTEQSRFVALTAAFRFSRVSW